MIPVIFYHKIGYPPKEARLKNLYVTPESFHRHLKYLKLRGFHTLNCEEYLKIKESKIKSHKKHILITFDDGYENNYTYAFPILEKFGFVATIFLVLKDIGKRVSWDESEENYPEEILSWEEILRMHDYGIDFQIHGYTHKHMERFDEEKLRGELIKAKKELEKKLNKNVRFLAYPYGTYNEKVKKIVRELGYYAAFTTWKGEEKDNFEIRRIGVKYDHSLLKFIKYIEFGKKGKLLKPDSPKKCTSPPHFGKIFFLE